MSASTSSSPSSESLPTQVASLDIDVDGDTPQASPQPPLPPLLDADPNADTDTNVDPHASHTTAKTTPALEALRTLLRQTLRITITDGRVFLGTFAGTDRLLNVLLVNTDEFVVPPPDSSKRIHVNPDGRFVGLVQIPWRLVVRAEVHRAEKLKTREYEKVGALGFFGTAGAGVGVRPGQMEGFEHAVGGFEADSEREASAAKFFGYAGAGVGVRPSAMEGYEHGVGERDEEDDSLYT